MALSGEDKAEIKALFMECQVEVLAIVDRKFISVGIDINDPIKMQKQNTMVEKFVDMSNKAMSRIIVGSAVLLFALLAAWTAITKFKLSNLFGGDGP